MNHQDVTVSNMMWCPPMIKVHQIPHPATSMGVTIAFVDPTTIQSIYSAVANSGAEGESAAPCTVIQMKTRDCLYVSDTTEAVARLRDEVFGYKVSQATLAVVPEK